MLSSAPTEKPIQILFLGDNSSDAELSMRKLRSDRLQFTVDVVATAEEFKERIQIRAYDVILAACCLPTWTGLEAVRWLRGSGSTTPFILLAGAKGGEQAAACLTEGATDYIIQDKLDRLPSAIQRALQEQRTRTTLDQAEHDLFRSKQQNASMIQDAPFGIYRAQRDGRILAANPALVSMLGYDSEAELLQLNLAQAVYVHAEDCERILSGVCENVASYGTATAWRRKDGRQIVVRQTARRLPSEPGVATVYAAFVQDLDGQRLLVWQFLQGQKMEAIGRLAGGLAHDVNNLLMIIGGCAELLELHQGQPEKTGRYLTQIHDATALAASLVQQLMDTPHPAESATPASNGPRATLPV
jgi:PAS domain S-box-containing protein